MRTKHTDISGGGERVGKDSLTLRHEMPNLLNINELGVFLKTTGTKTGQYSLLPDGDEEDLSGRKKMPYAKPSPLLDYIPPRLTEGKEWYVSFSVRHPATGKMQRFRIKVNRIKNLKERRAAARQLCARIAAQLAIGWTPFIEQTAPRAETPLCDALDSFLKVKTKEAEENSIRSYRSYVKRLRSWMKEYGLPETMCCAAFTKKEALDLMDDIDDDENLCPRTFNNYRAFFIILWNWMKERGYVSANPFTEVKKKPKKLTAKTRRILTEAELSRTFTWLEENNPNYLAACLLCFCCFIRPKELASLKVGDFMLKKQLVAIHGEIAKNDKTSYRTMPDSMMKHIVTLDFSDPAAYLFGDGKGYEFKPSRKKLCSRKLAKYWDDHVREACGLPMEVQFYSLKDTGMTLMSESGVPIGMVQKQADHSSLAVTSIYVGTSGLKAEEALKAADIIPL